MKEGPKGFGARKPVPLHSVLLEMLQTLQIHHWAPGVWGTAEKRARENLFQKVSVKPRIWGQPAPLNSKTSSVLMSKPSSYCMEVGYSRSVYKSPEKWFSKCGSQTKSHQHHFGTSKSKFLDPTLRSTKSETLWLEASNLCVNNLSRWFWYMLKIENHCMRKMENWSQDPKD